ncbi:MAG: glycosyltransferase family 2 protein [Opitutus sp.]|nr:glycosyltransferase family 2 protein [Opitutus sp.]
MSLELTILMPCLNEALTIPACVKKAQVFLRDHQIEGEVVVADNGSTDGSRELATELGARVVPVPVRGYGAALAAGIESARGRFVIMGDSDDSYDFSALLPFVEKLREGYELVMGNRFRGGIAPGAMPPSHRYFGNPMLTWVGRLFFNCKTCGDFYCGLRGFEKRAIQRLDLQSRGMEFALEMLIKAGMNGLRITEVPTTLSPDGRDRPPHLRSYRDGWRSLRLYLLMSPRWFFAVPGFSLLALGAIVIGALLSGPVSIGGVRFDYHTLIYGAAVFVLGYQAIIAGAFAKLIAVEAGLHPPVTKLWFLESRAMFERLLIAGGILGAAGIVLGLFATQQWAAAHFGNLLPADTIRLVVCSVLLLILGGQTALAGCLSGMINLLADRREQKTEERVRRERSAVSRTTDSTFTAIRSEA